MCCHQHEVVLATVCFVRQARAGFAAPHGPGPTKGLRAAYPCKGARGNEIVAALEVRAAVSSDERHSPTCTPRIGASEFYRELIERLPHDVVKRDPLGFRLILHYLDRKQPDPPLWPAGLSA